ncbi:GNAT family N-acetyltransferase [Corynebacterium kutscheri]|uniref:GNAT family N-acetyltransferase n=1 Tax=Corynebacterium kutscheri TaxID=35755 RepID=UPI00062386DD|nr:GNAT family N-acetyltransferase [Corynebacterium kutscheri]
MTLKILRLTPAEFSHLVPQFVDIYLAAMHYEPTIRLSRIGIWRRAVTEKDFISVCAHNDQHILGIAYGFRGHRDHWWNQQIRRGLRENHLPGGKQKSLCDDYFELVEIHVIPAAQGNGIGEALLVELFSHITSPYVLLSTPEVPEEDNNAFRLYRRNGFVDVLRNFHFQGDHRPFAILGKDLTSR